MPEYGLCDKSPEELDEEKFIQEQQTIFKAAEAAELEARRRQAAAEESIIRTAEMLNQMSSQLQQIQDVQEAEQQTRISAENRAEKESHTQKQIDRARFWITTTIALIGSLAAIGSLIATIVLN